MYTRSLQDRYYCDLVFNILLCASLHAGTRRELLNISSLCLSMTKHRIDAGEEETPTPRQRHCKFDFILYIFKHLFSQVCTQRRCILSYGNSTAMYKFLKKLAPWRDSNPRSSVM
jgi:hypothetical protein